jgi:hypothetical protein
VGPRVEERGAREGDREHRAFAVRGVRGARDRLADFRDARERILSLVDEVVRAAPAASGAGAGIARPAPGAPPQVRLAALAEELRAALDDVIDPEELASETLWLEAAAPPRPGEGVQVTAFRRRPGSPLARLSATLVDLEDERGVVDGLPDRLAIAWTGPAGHGTLRPARALAIEVDAREPNEALVRVGGDPAVRVTAPGVARILAHARERLYAPLADLLPRSLADGTARPFERRRVPEGTSFPAVR